MKKVITFSLAILAALAFTAGSSYACGGNKSCSMSGKSGKASASTSTTTDGKLASSSKSCSMAKADGKLASSANGCSAHKAGTAAVDVSSYTYLPVNARTIAANHDANCGASGKCQLVNISVEGMTCGGCENGIKEALGKVDGVNMVLNVDYKEGIAQVCSSTKADKTAMTSAIVTAGFTAQVIPAVAKTTTKSAKKGSLANGTIHANGPACAKACSAAKGKHTSAKTKAPAKKSSGSSAKGDTY